MQFQKSIIVCCVVTLAALTQITAQTTAPNTLKPVPTGPATIPATPMLTALPEGMSNRIQEVVEARKALRIDLSKVRADAYRRLRENVPNLAVFASSETRQAISNDVAQAVREMLQIDFAHNSIGTLSDARDVALYGAIFSTRENGMYHAVLLQACGDIESVEKVVNYFGFPAEAVTLAAEFVVADEKSQQELAAKMAARLDLKNEADIAGMEATMLVLRREVLIDPKQNDLLLEKLKAAAATPAVKTAITRYESQVKSKAVMGQLGQPIELKGALVDGSSFTSASLLGKVIVVDFWATWCGPCKAELPRLKALRAQYRDRGLELVSISNDYSKEQLVSYLKNAGDMDWPQLFDEQACADKKWHPITTGFGINAIPALYVIDRKGVLRHVEARKDLEKIVPQLLDEQ